MSGAQPRRTVRVVAGNDGSTTHIARFSTPPGPNLTRPDIAVTMARDDKAIMRRVRAGAKEATRPWLLTAPHPVRAPEPLTYVGTLEESQCNRYVLLVPHEGGFRTVPCHEWYSFVPRPAKVAAMKRADHERTMREAEERMRARHNQSDLYLERKTVCRPARGAGEPPLRARPRARAARRSRSACLGPRLSARGRCTGRGEGRRRR